MNDMGNYIGKYVNSKVGTNLFVSCGLRLVVVNGGRNNSALTIFEY